ncbi:MAG TPA: TAXI family TRAP transporter solute-binding subunit [Candidatus Rifleibacterium sp.]|nr:TAXI family TRAP transporter solute-binding subunit [Candidatus Rifleibacterium sp.]HPT47817.1 TAXI family TRAP transporter solute-binding subunit [Candidatus Rifleibacterium sp.]
MQSGKSGNIPEFAWPLLLLLAIMALLLLSTPQSAEEVETPLPPHLYSSSFQLIGTGNRLGTYYPVGGILSDWFNSHCEASGGVFSAIETNGSVDNVRLLVQGRLMLGMTESRIVRESWQANASSPLRLVWPLWNDVVHLVKAPASFAPSREFPGHLRGFLGQKNSSTYRTSKEILDALGVSKDFSTLELPPDRVLTAVSTGQIGFATIQAGMPNRTVSDALIFNDCSLISLDDRQIMSVLAKVATARLFSIPAGFYGDSQPAIQTIGLPNVLITTDKTPAATIELLTDLLVKASSHLRMKHQAIAAIPADPARGLAILKETGVPIHQGTLDWLAKNLPASGTFQEGGPDGR